MRNRRVLIIVGAGAAATLLLAVLGPFLFSPKGNRSQPVPYGQMARIITAKGVVESSEEVTVSSQVKGVISRVYVHAGDSVEKGQLLLEFDRYKLHAQLLQAKASLAAARAHLSEAQAGYRKEEVSMARYGRQRALAVYQEAKSEYERQARLLQKDAVTPVEVSRAEEQMRVAEAQLQASDANLAKLHSGVRPEEIRFARAGYDRAVADFKMIEEIARDYRIVAPIAGVVAQRHRTAGESTAIGSPLFTLINPAYTRIRAELEESEIGRVTVGQSAEITADAYPGKTFAGRVTKVFPIVQKKTQKSFDPMASFDINTQEIQIRLQDRSAFKNGMTVTVRFT